MLHRFPTTLTHYLELNFLEILIMEIRGKTIAFASNKKKEQEIIEKQLEEEIKKY